MKVYRTLTTLMLLTIVLPRAEAVADGDSSNLITGIRANQLLCRIVEQYGLSLARRKLGSITLVNEEDPDIDALFLDNVNDSVMHRGFRYELIMDDVTVGFVQVGVFLDPNEAYEIFSDHILHTSMGPNKHLGAKLTENSVGWWDETLKGYGRILFGRDNAVVDISLFLKRYIDLQGKVQSVLEMAEAIDMALIKGSHGVRRGPTITVPKLLAVDTPQSIRGGAETEITSHILIPRTLDKGDDYKVDRPIKVHAPKVEKKRTLKYKLTYISSECVVVTKSLSIDIEPESDTVLREN